MTRIAETGDKWFTVYVPQSIPQNGGGGGTPEVATQESYLRLGSPDGATEQAFLGALRSAYAGAGAQAAVEAAFGSSPTAGITMFTEGDLVQLVNGKADMRVLNDSYLVHVLNREDASLSNGSEKTYRTYFRLGKPNADVEAPLQGAVAPDQLVAFIRGLLPSGPVPAIAGVSTASTVLPVDSSAQSQLALAGSEQARSLLVAAACLGDAAALDAIEALRTSSDTRAGDEADKASVKAWALGALQGIHLAVARWRRDQALLGLGDSRLVLSSRARASDPLARRKLVELAESSSAKATTAQNGQSPARDWAKGELDVLAPGGEIDARWSLGDGVALYSDKAVTLSTPEALKVTVGKDSRTVLGPTYSETYDVSDDVIDAIKNGWVSGLSEISDKRLITAALTRRDALGATWRTTKLDLSKSLTFAAADNGTFTVGSEYAFWAGLKIANSFGVAFEANAGASLAAPLGVKVEIANDGLETAWAGGKVSYSSQGTLKGDSLQLSVDPASKATLLAMKPLGSVIRTGMGVVNAALAAYTSAFAAIGANTTADSDGATANVKEMMEAGEAVYMAAAGLNAILAAITLVAGVVQIATEKAANAATNASPVQPANIIMNDAGIKLQVGSNYVHIGASGIVLSGTQVMTASPMSSFVPASPPANSTPASLLQQAKVAKNAGKTLTSFV